VKKGRELKHEKRVGENDITGTGMHSAGRREDLTT
jgi:hypothetical protein